jgi:hypothetical protein
VTDNQAADLAGNAFASTVVLSLLLAVYAHCPEYAWTDDETCDKEAEPEEVAALCRFLDSDGEEPA